MSNLRSSLLNPGGTHQSVSPLSRRGGTIALELQAAVKFALAMAVGLGAIVADLSTPLAAVTLIVAILVAGRALAVLGADPGDRTTFRPTAEASWDAALAAAWGLLAVVLAADGATVGALVAGAGAVVLAFLRLRTRYVR